MKLEFAESEPESTRIRLALEAKGLFAEELETGDRPVLRHGNRILRGAPSILEYLDEEFSDRIDLRPESIERRERMNLWIEWADGAFASDARTWREDRALFSAEDRFALEVRLEKHLYRLKTPLQKNRRFLVVDALTRADLAAYSVLTPLRECGFPVDYPERFALVFEWADRVLECVRAGRVPAPKVLRRAGSAIWPNSIESGRN